MVAVTQSAQTGKIAYTNGALGAGNPVTLQISGNLGTEQVSVQGGTDVAGMVAAINQVKNATGVSAATSGTALVLNSMNYGSDQYVSLSTVSGTFVPMANSSYGRDAGVTINGAAAEANGLNVSYRSNNLDIQLDLTAAFNTVGNDSFYITGGGAQFMLGPKVTEADKASLGIGSVAAGSLGDTTDGFLSTLGTGGANDLASDNLVTSQRIIEKAITQVATLRGRLGAFQKEVLSSNINSLSVALENVTASESDIRDADFASETAAMTRAQILVQATTSVLAQANASPQNVLALLKG